MEHTLKISISQERSVGGIVACRQVSIREKLLRLLLGDNRRLMVIIPGDTVKAISIVEEGGEDSAQSQAVV